MDIKWDDRKAEDNLKKHGVSFEEAATVLTSPLTFTVTNEYPEQVRHESIGYSALDRVLYVVTHETKNEEIRIISARKASKKERKNYEERV